MSENNLNQENIAVSPYQMNLFEKNVENNAQNVSGEEVTMMEIPHNNSTNNVDPAILQEQATSTEEFAGEDEVTASTKLKILAALAIVGIAGYVAYWVQEPVQLKAELFGSFSNSGATDDETVDLETSEQSSAAEADTLMNVGASVNVDVSLFGFEPATLKIDKGTTVIWTNTSTEDQTIIGSSENGQSFASPVMTSGQSFSYKFDQDGTFEYYSTYNPALKAAIMVGLGTISQAESISSNTAPTIAAPVSDTSAPIDAGTALSTAIALTNTASSLGQETNFVAVADTTANVVAATSISAQEIDELKGAAPAKLTKTGPTENLYAAILLGIAWLNRKKLQKVFQK